MTTNPKLEDNIGVPFGICLKIMSGQKIKGDGNVQIQDSKYKDYTNIKD